ncbi:MAG: methyltransferase domain-containing protein [Pseudomonadota bacterium]
MSETDFQAAITARYDAPMYRALLEVYGDQIHPGFFETGREDLQAAALEATKRLAELADLQPSSCVLETACGVGGTARYLAAAYGVDMTATNISKGQLETAAEWTAGKPGAERITYAFADFQALPYEDGSFDVYWCQDSLLFSPDRSRAIAEAARVLRPGGTIAITDLTVVGMPAGASEALLAEISEPGFWSLGDYIRGLESAGFVVMAQEDWGRHVLPFFERIRRDIRDNREKLAAYASLAEVDDTIVRYDLWRDASRTGHLGWGAVIGRKPEE